MTSAAVTHESRDSSIGSNLRILLRGKFGFVGQVWFENPANAELFRPQMLMIITFKHCVE